MKKRLTKDKILGASTYILVTAAFLVLQLLMNQGKLSSTMKGFLVPACAYVVLAVSLNLLVGICGELSLGHAGFMGIGAFSGVIVTALLAQAVPNGVLRLVIAMLVGGVLAGARISTKPMAKVESLVMPVAPLGPETIMVPPAPRVRPAELMVA